MHQNIPPGLKQEALDNYAHNFFGYGRWTSRIWLIGLEEWGAQDADEFTRRFVAWNPNPVSLVDLRQFIAQDGINIQLDWNNPTWRAMHTICRQAGFNQIGDLCQENGNWGGNGGYNANSIALIEAMPFPSPSTKSVNWPYQIHENANWGEYGIETRESCAGRFLHKRLEILVRKLERYRPQLVILYGRDYAKGVDMRKQWIGETVANAIFSEIVFNKGFVQPEGNGRMAHFLLGKVNWVNGNNTLLACIPQPSSFRGRCVPELLGNEIRASLEFE